MRQLLAFPRMAAAARRPCSTARISLWNGDPPRHNRSMDFNRLTEKLQEAFRAAQTEAVRYGNQQIDVEHLLAALLEQEGGLAPAILRRAEST